MNPIQLYLSPEHPCPYLPDREARMMFLDPQMPLDSGLYARLTDMGFRRSGSMVYRPECTGCRRCTPVRVSADRFQPRRAQRRALNKWQHVQVVIENARFLPEHFTLFSRYLSARHPNGGMDEMTEQQYRGFISCGWSETLLVEFRMAGQLLAVTVIDLLPRGISAVYTFFDPDCSAMSPGVFAILWQLGEARRRGRQWVYLGFHVPGCGKMEYKKQYRPLQLYDYRLNHWSWSD